MALKKLEQKYAELKGKISTDSAGVTEPAELESIKANVEANVRAKLGLDEE